MQRKTSHMLAGAGLGLLVYFFLNFHELDYATWPHWRDTIAVLIAGGVIALLLDFIHMWTSQIIRWKDPSGLRMLANLVLDSIVSIGLVLIIIHMYRAYFYPYETIQESVGIKTGLLIFIILLFKGILSFAVTSIILYQEQERQFISQERRQIDLQLNALKSKLSPHFLFNCLNAISSLMHKDPDKAETFIRRLANSYRYTLEKYDKPWVSLEEELQVVDAYHFLLTTRFARHLDLDVDIPQELWNTKIPPLTLQMLVENAAKHNLVDDQHNLRVEIRTDGKWISVSNNLTSTPETVTSSGIGLSNIADRYRILASRDILIENNGAFTVKIPVVS